MFGDKSILPLNDIDNSFIRHFTQQQQKVRKLVDKRELKGVFGVLTATCQL